MFAVRAGWLSVMGVPTALTIHRTLILAHPLVPRHFPSP